MIAGWLKFWGNPGVALLLAVLTALVVLARRRGLRLEGLRGEVSHALNDVGSLILIIGASGAFKQVIVDSGAGAEFAGLLLRWHIPPLGSAFLVGAALRIALGSATASMITAAGLVAPVAASSAASHVLIALALTAGASVFANVNDAGFWMVQEYCGMSVSQTLKTYSMVKAVTATTAFAIICIIACFT
jgi:H+/gluconate symporter-like permease